MATKKHDERAEWINNITGEREGREKGPKTDIHIDLFKTLKRIPNRRTPGHDGIHGFWFKKFPFIHDRLAHIDPKRLKQRNYSKQL